MKPEILGEHRGTYVEPIMELLEKIKPKKSLEIGIGYFAYSTQVILGYSDSTLITCDKQDWHSCGVWLKKMYGKRWKFVGGDSKRTVPRIKEKFDFIYIDGDHEYSGCKADILNCQPLLKKGGHMLIDDYGIEYGVVDVTDKDDHLINGKYGVRGAVDEILTNDPKWRQVFQDIPFANGAVCYEKNLR